MQNDSVYNTRSLIYNYSEASCMISKLQQMAYEKCGCVYMIYPFESILKKAQNQNKSVKFCNHKQYDYMYENLTQCNLSKLEDAVCKPKCNCIVHNQVNSYYYSQRICVSPIVKNSAMIS